MRFEWGKVSIKICVEHICVSIYRENELNWGIIFLIFRKFKFVSVIWESLKEILSSEKELNQIWGSASPLDRITIFPMREFPSNFPILY